MDETMQKAINAAESYLKQNGLEYTGEVTYTWGIDFVGARINGVPVLSICIPPTSKNYNVRLGKGADLYLKKSDVDKLPVAA